MKGLPLGIAYFLIWSTPLQAGIVLWALAVVFTTDATVLSLTNHAFLSNHLPFLHALVKGLLSVFPDSFANFVWSLPIVFHASLKAIVNTALGLWLLPIAKEMSSTESVGWVADRDAVRTSPGAPSPGQK